MSVRSLSEGIGTTVSLHLKEKYPSETKAVVSPPSKSKYEIMTLTNCLNISKSIQSLEKLLWVGYTSTLDSTIWNNA